VVCRDDVVRLVILIFLLIFIVTNYSPILNNHFNVSCSMLSVTLSLKDKLCTFHKDGDTLILFVEGTMIYPSSVCDISVILL